METEYNVLATVLLFPSVLENILLLLIICITYNWSIYRPWHTVTLGPIVTDYEQLTVQINWQGNLINLQGLRDHNKIEHQQAN